MKLGTILGIVLLVLVLAVVLYGLSYASEKVGRAMETGESSGYITPCKTNADCPTGQTCEVEHCRTT